MNNETVAAKLEENDVVCGRNKLAHTHSGNKYFRKLIDEKSDAYKNAAVRSDKNRIANEVITMIEKRGGRFLMLPLDNPTPDKSLLTDLQVASPAYKYEKVSHALRSIRKARASKGNKNKVARKNNLPRKNQVVPITKSIQDSTKVSSLEHNSFLNERVQSTRPAHNNNIMNPSTIISGNYGGVFPPSVVGSTTTSIPFHSEMNNNSSVGFTTINHRHRQGPKPVIMIPVMNPNNSGPCHFYAADTTTTSCSNIVTPPITPEAMTTKRSTVAFGSINQFFQNVEHLFDQEAEETEETDNVHDEEYNNNNTTADDDDDDELYDMDEIGADLCREYFLSEIIEDEKFIKKNKIDDFTTFTGPNIFDDDLSAVLEFEGNDF